MAMAMVWCGVVAVEAADAANGCIVPSPTAPAATKSIAWSWSWCPMDHVNV